MTKKNPYTLILPTELIPVTHIDINMTKHMDSVFEDLTLYPHQIHEFNACVFNRVKFEGDFSKVAWIDCRFDHCDLNNTNFSESRFHRVEWQACKALGINLDRCVWTYVSIHQSNLTYASFSDAKLSDVKFIESSLFSASLFSCHLKNLTFKVVDLNQADLSDTPLKDIDISSCSIEGIRLSPHLLKGMRVSDHQAIALIGLLGIQVKE